MSIYTTYTCASVIGCSYTHDANHKLIINIVASELSNKHIQNFRCTLTKNTFRIYTSDGQTCIITLLFKAGNLQRIMREMILRCLRLYVAQVDIVRTVDCCAISPRREAVHRRQAYL